MNTNDRRILAVIGLVAGLLSLVTWLLPIWGLRSHFGGDPGLFEQAFLSPQDCDVE